MRIVTWLRASAGAVLAIVLAVLTVGVGARSAAGEPRELGAMGGAESSGAPSDGESAAGSPEASQPLPQDDGDRAAGAPDSPASAENASGAQSRDPNHLPGPAPDYYSRRARETLEQDAKLRKIVPHALAAAHADADVVVCDAGCSREQRPEIVSLRPKSARLLTRPKMEPSSAGSSGAASQRHVPDAALATEAQSRVIDCLGGCFDTPRRYRARAAVQSAAMNAEPSAVSASDGWVTTITRAESKSEPVSPAR